MLCGVEEIIFGLLWKLSVFLCICYIYKYVFCLFELIIDKWDIYGDKKIINVIE